MSQLQNPVASTDAARQSTSLETTQPVSKDAADTQARLTPSQTSTLSKIAKIWEGQVEKDLQARFKVGQQINTHLVKTVKKNGRQPYGKGFLQLAADRLGLSKGEVSRMRNFAKKFTDFEAFRQQHPDVRTWTQVKQQVLPKAKSPKDSDAETYRRVPVITIADRIEKASVHLNHGLRVDRETNDWKALYGALRTLITEANKALGTDFADRMTASESPTPRPSTSV